MKSASGLRRATLPEKSRGRPAHAWLWAGLSGIVALGLAFAWLAQAPAQYRASCTVVLRADPGGQTTAGAGPSVAVEAEALKARHLMEQAVAELSLSAGCFRPGWPQPTELYGSAAPVRVQVGALRAEAGEQLVTLYLRDGQTYELDDRGPGRSTHRFGEEVRCPYGSFTVLRTGAGPARRLPSGKVAVRLRTVPQAAELYGRSLTVVPVNQQPALLTISVLAPGPRQGNDLVTKLVEVYNREQQQARRAQVANTIRFIDRRLVALGRELSAPAAPDANRAAVTPVPAAGAWLVRAQLARAEAQRTAVAALARALTAGGALPRLPALPGPGLPPLVAQWNALQAERARMLRTAQPENPLVVDLTEQLAVLRGRLQVTLRTVAAGLAVAHRALAARGGAATGRPDRPPVAVPPRAAPRPQQEAKQALYRYFLQRKEEAALALTAADPAARVLDPARATPVPRTPSAPVVYLLSLLIGLVVPWGLLHWRGRPHSEQETGAPAGPSSAPPVLGAVGPLPPDQLLAVAANSESQPAETYHRLRDHWWAYLAGEPAQVLLVSSGQAGEGQTVVALNLAASLGQTGRQVLVLDFNLRTPHLDRYVKRVVSAGVSTYLGAKTLPLAPLLRQHGLGLNVSWLGAGPVPTNPAELVASGRTAELLEELKPQFDHILLLTAPLNTATDVLTLALLADACLYVARPGYARTALLQRLEQIFQERRRRPPVVVLNEGPRCATAPPPAG